MILYTCRSTACSALGVGAGLVFNRMRGDSRQGWRAEATTQRGWRHAPEAVCGPGADLQWRDHWSELGVACRGSSTDLEIAARCTRGAL